MEVIAGNARGARGRILRALPRQGKVVVEGINMVWKHMRRTRQNPQGGRIEMEAPIDASNVMLLCRNRECDRYDRPVRTCKERTEDGKKIRVCVKCGAEIPKVE